MSTDKDIRYAITAEDRFSRVFRTLRSDISGSASAIGGLVSSSGALGVALGAVGVAGVGFGALALGVKKLAGDIDALNEASAATGATVESLSGLEDVARRNGASLDLVLTTTLKLNKALTEANPNSPTGRALKALGLDAAELRQLDPADAVQKVARALSGFADDGNKARLTQELLGKATKEVAKYLNDVVEAGTLNTTVTTQQAKAAKVFNDNLTDLQTNVNNVARSIANNLIPTINRLFADVQQGGLTKALGLDGLQSGFDRAIQAYRLLGLARERITPLSILDKDPTNAKALAQLEAIDAKARDIGAAFRAASAAASGLTSQAGAGRGVVNPPSVKFSVGDITKVDDLKAKTTEADRYLERLQKEAEGYERMSNLSKLLNDIEHQRIDGLTPALEKRLRLEAQAADRRAQSVAEQKQEVEFQKELNALKERELGFQKLLSDGAQRGIDEAQRLLAQTKTGQLESLDAQADKLLDFSRRIDADDPRQKQILEAFDMLKQRAREVIEPTKAVGKEFDTVADTIEKSMDRASGSLIDLALGANVSVADIGKAFARDVLRALIEEPVRDSVKRLVSDIRKELGELNEDNPLRQFAAFLAGIFKSPSGDGGNGLLGAVGNLFGGGFTGRANGGSVNAGGLVRWQENGREWFIPGADGAVVNQAQMRGLAGGGGGVQQVNHITISGASDPAQTQRQIDAALARNNAALVRSMRLGGAMAG